MVTCQPISTGAANFEKTLRLETVKLTPAEFVT